MKAVFEANRDPFDHNVLLSFRSITARAPTKELCVEVLKDGIQHVLFNADIKAEVSLEWDGSDEVEVKIESDLAFVYLGG